MNVKLEGEIEVHFPDYIEVISETGDSVIFSLYYTVSTGFKLICEKEGNVENVDSPLDKCYDLINEITIYDDLLKVIYNNGIESYQFFKIKEIHLYKNNQRQLEGNLIKYSSAIAEKYNLKSEYAYDYVKPKKRTKTVAF